MERLLIFIIVLLLLFVFVLGAMLRVKKKQIRIFTRQVKNVQGRIHHEQVKVDYFSKEFLELANALNEYMEQQGKMREDYLTEQQHLSEVIAGISHDFRTPLTAAKGYLQLVEKNDVLNGDNKEYLEIAVAKIAYLKQLSDDFFDVTSLQAEGEELEMRQINIGNLLSEIVLEQYSWIEEKELEFTCEIPEKSIQLMGNEKILIRIIENIFSNAKKYAVSTLNFGVTQMENTLTLVLSNDVSENVDTDSIFDIFYRGNARVEEGSGIGLYVVKNLCDQMGYGVCAKCKEYHFTITVTIQNS